MKSMVQRNFGKASTTYHLYDEVQKKSAFRLAHIISHACPMLHPQIILDVGCGTGNLTHALHRIFPHASYHINDISDAMLTEVFTHHKMDCEWIPGDIEHINLSTVYDIIASNMCLQWVDDMRSVVKKLAQHTKILAFSCLLEGTFRGWYDVLESFGMNHASRSYPSQKDVTHLFADMHHKILHASCESFCLSFQSAQEGASYLKNIGANGGTFCQSDVGKMRAFLRCHHKICHLEYNIGFFVVERMV